jgi:hypothetical protein
MTRACNGRLWLMAIVVLLAAGPTGALAQAPAPGGHHDAVTESTAGQQQNPAAPARPPMMKNMAAADQRLLDLVVKMNMATGEEKVAAMAAVVNELVVQRRQMQEQMRMQGDMMEAMMSRMSAMHGAGGMMKKTPEPVPDANPTDHADHHPQK